MSDSPTPPDSSHDDAPQDDAASKPGGFRVLDLSSSEGRGSNEPASWKRKRKQASPILTKIVDLSAQTPSKPDPAPPKAEANPPRKEKKRDERKGRSKPSGGATLADLLDPDTLARLRRED